LQGHTVKNWKRRFFLIHGGLVYYFAGENDPVAKGIVPLTGASVAIHRTDDPLFMGVRVAVNIPFATKFKESRKGKKEEKIKAWPELVLQVSRQRRHTIPFTFSRRCSGQDTKAARLYD
jgi:hypothetical protein